jgi:hypothetical protein
MPTPKKPRLAKQAWDLATTPLWQPTPSGDAVTDTVKGFVAAQTSPLDLALLGLSGGASLAGRAGKFGISNAARLAEAIGTGAYGAEGAVKTLGSDTPAEALSGLSQVGLSVLGAKQALKAPYSMKAIARNQMAPNALEEMAPHMAAAHKAMPDEPLIFSRKGVQPVPMDEDGIAEAIEMVGPISSTRGNVTPELLAAFVKRNAATLKDPNRAVAIAPHPVQPNRLSIGVYKSADDEVLETLNRLMRQRSGGR